MTHAWAIGLALLSGLLGGIGVVLLKKGADKFNFKISLQLKNQYLIGGIVSCGTGMLSLLVALNGGELSVLYPLVSVQYIISALLSVKFLNERMNLLKWAGIITIILGIILIGLGI